MSETTPSVGALVNYYNDARMIELQWDHGQFDHYDQICILDGPYSYTKALSFGADNEAAPFDQTEIGQIMLADPRVTYDYQIWPDEAAKRIAAYEAMNTDLVALHDSDEFLEFDEEKLTEFVTAGKSVAGFWCQNLCLDGAYFAQPFYAVDHVEGLPHKNFLFRRADISAAQHLDYLWLVGVNQHTTDPAKISDAPVALGYHFTCMRSRPGQIQKFVFYTSLNQVTSGHLDETVERLSAAVEVGLIEPDEALAVYLAAIPSYWGAPNPYSNMIIKHRIKGSPVLEAACRKIQSEINVSECGPFKLLSGYAYYLYRNANEEPWDLICEGSRIDLHSFDYNYDKLIGERVFVGEFQDRARLETASGPNVHGRLYLIHARTGCGKEILDAELKIV